MPPATSTNATSRLTTRYVRRRDILRWRAARWRRASSLRARRFGPPGVAGATAGFGGTEAPSGREVVRFRLPAIRPSLVGVGAAPQDTGSPWDPEVLRPIHVVWETSGGVGRAPFVFEDPTHAKVQEGGPKLQSSSLQRRAKGGK